MENAGFEHAAPASSPLLITRLDRSLSGVRQDVLIAPGSAAFRAYGEGLVTEQFNCSYGLNEAYRTQINGSNLNIVGKDVDGSARIVELASHPFFIATLFLPQLSSREGEPHPLIMGFMEAAMVFQKSGAGHSKDPCVMP